jgi:hypothetical protein
VTGVNEDEVVWVLLWLWVVEVAEDDFKVDEGDGEAEEEGAWDEEAEEDVGRGEEEVGGAEDDASDEEAGAEELDDV